MSRWRAGRRWIGRALLGLVLATGAAPVSADELLVFGAASLRNALDAVTEAYRAAGGGPVKAVYAASSTLARQIERGAPADLYLSANPEWMAYLEERGLIRGDTRIDLLGNALVLIAPKNSDARLEVTKGLDLLGALDGGRLAMGDPDHVPAGIYGKAALEGLGVWGEVAPEVARADNVRAALALVARGEAPLGVVYRSDAVADDAVRVVDSFPEGSHPEIVYPLAVVAGSSHPDAEALAAFMASDAAAAIFERFGFTVLD